MDSFTALLVDFLTSVNEDNNQGNGWVTVNSLLTAPNVAGTNGLKSWSPGPGEEFTGDTLACVLGYAAQYERGKYPAIQ
eukprot:1221427-Heterocapsa_arctica.AAC.1